MLGSVDRLSNFCRSNELAASGLVCVECRAKKDRLVIMLLNINLPKRSQAILGDQHLLACKIYLNSLKSFKM